MPLIDSAVLLMIRPASIGERGTECFETDLYVVSRDCDVVDLSRSYKGSNQGCRAVAQGVKGRQSFRQSAVARSNFPLIQTALKKSFCVGEHDLPQSISDT